MVTFCITISTESFVFAKSDNFNFTLFESYQEVVESAEKYNVLVNMSFDEYARNYNPVYKDWGDMQKYILIYLKNQLCRIKAVEGKGTIIIREKFVRQRRLMVDMIFLV